MRLADHLRWANDCADGALDTLGRESRQMIAQQLIGAALRVASGPDRGACLELGNVTITTPGVCAWQAVTDELPDDETTVLMHLSDGEVWTGYRDGEGWCYASGDQISGATVTHWAHLPEGPRQDQRPRTKDQGPGTGPDSLTH